MATEKFSIIIDAKDETKRAIDSATRNFKQLQDLGNGGNGVTANGRQTMICDKSSERFSKDVSVFKDSIKDFGNSIKSAFTMPSVAKKDISSSDIKLDTNRKQMKGDLSQLIPSMKKAVKEGVMEGIRDSGGLLGQGKRGGGSGTGQRKGLVSSITGGLGNILGAMRGHIVGFVAAALGGVAMKISQNYQRTLMAQSQLSGVVRPNFLNRTPRYFTRLVRRVDETRVRQYQQDLAQDPYSGIETGNQAALRRAARQQMGANREQRQEASRNLYLKNLARYGITSPDLQRMEFARLRAGGAMGARISRFQGRDSKGKLIPFSQVGYIRGTGMDLAEGMGMMTTLARYGGGRQANIGQIAALGAGAGFGGAMNPEFMRMVTQAVQEGTQAGFSGTPEEIAKNMNIAMNLRDRRGRNVWDRQKLSRESGLSMMRSFQSVMQGAGRLQGGQQQEMMMTALIQQAQSQEGLQGGEALQYALERVTDARYTTQNMQLMKQFTGGLEGQGTLGQRLALMQFTGGYRQAGALQQADLRTGRGGQLIQRPIQGRTPYGQMTERQQRAYFIQNERTRLLMERGGVGENAFKIVSSIQTALLKVGEGLNKFVASLTGAAKKIGNLEINVTGSTGVVRMLERGANQQGNPNQ